jgi:hypothetical protein
MEFLIRNFDDTHSDSERDKAGCRKRGMCDAEMPDGHVWGRLEGLPKFIILRCPEVQHKSELGHPDGFRKKWFDFFDYEIVATRPNYGEFDIRIFEVNPGDFGQNHIKGNKAIRIRNFLQSWGCTNFVLSATDASFTFSLWDAVRSARFWNYDLVGTQFTFTLQSYSPETGIGQIFSDFSSAPAWMNPDQVARRVISRGGVILDLTDLSIVFTIEKLDIIKIFRSEVKSKTEQAYMFQQHRLNAVVMDQAVANGGIITLTKAELLASIVDHYKVE